MEKYKKICITSMDGLKGIVDVNLLILVEGFPPILTEFVPAG